MKRLLACLVIVLVTAFAAASADETVLTDASGQWKYVLVDGGAELVGYVEEPSGELVIPGELDGYAVTSIGELVFVHCDALTSVIIPEGVTQIGDGAFEKCYALTSVTMPGSVTHIGEAAFIWCTALTGVTIPEGVVEIGMAAFAGCSSLASLSIPASVTSIHRNPFSGTALTHIHVAQDNPVYEEKDGVLFHRESKELIAYPTARQGAYAIPEGTLSIAPWAFVECTGLTSIVVPASVTSIADSAFGDCVFYECHNLILRVARGSYAEQYAIWNVIPYELMDGQTPKK